MRRNPSHLPRLTLSLLLVLGVHIGLGVLALNWRVEAAPVELPPAAMLLELAPLPTVAPPPPPAPAAVIEPPPRPEPVIAPKPKLALEKPKPKAKTVAKQVKPAPTPPTQTAKPVEQSAPTVAAAPAAPNAAAATQQPISNAPSAAKVSWQSQLLGHLARYKRYPDEARRRGIEGTSQVRFSLDGQGKVLSVELAKSSGNTALDRATQAMIRRASPVPKPPAELLSNGQLEIVAPFIYELERR